MKNKIKQILINKEDIKYKEFNQKLFKTKYKYIGVRIPILRKLAPNYLKYINDIDDEYFEEILLKGILIGKIKTINKSIEYIDCYLKYIDNWLICDTFICSLKITNQYKEEMFKYIIKYKDSKEEYELRFLIVMLIYYYIDKKYIDEIFEIIEYIRKEDYYVQMAVAWLISICFIKQKEKTYNYLKNNTLDKFTFNKSISKINDSYKVTKEEKEILKTLKNNRNL